jgi:NAD(P)-dependent dehydrogenase (short-subunit alcohol dehydrogenase family)
MKTVLITGISGGIGRALGIKFKEEGWFVIGLDKQIIKNNEEFCDNFILCDLNKYVKSPKYRLAINTNLDKHTSGKINVLINNAAVQILGGLQQLDVDDWNKTLNINLTAPFLLTKFFYKQLKSNDGSIINIGSIHAKLTKRTFLAYATSKSALMGLTKSLSIELGGEIRVNSISPAAVDTEMLRDGFGQDSVKLKSLIDIHPTRTIGKVREIANLAYFLCNDEMHFLHGSNIEINGGIANVLKDIEN